MISRYTRRPVSHNLEIRGLSRSSLDHHPPPEEADDVLVPQHLLHGLQETASTCDSSEASAASAQSDCPTVATGDTARPWSGIHSYTGTGVSTERSSVFSWGYDEFDKAASRQVQQMFEEIDEELYEVRGGGAKLRGLQEECQQWASRFPHLRILGTQLVCPSDEGFQWFSTSGRISASSPSPEPWPGPDTGREAGLQDQERQGTGLCVQGRRAVLSKSCVLEVEPPSGTPSGCQGHDKPRVIEAEGLMEEYLAYDCRDLDEEWEREDSDPRRGRHFLPPVSPYRCRRQAVLELLFDDVWHELVGCMEELVCRHWEGCVSDDEKIPVSFSLAGCEAQNPFLVLSPTLPGLLPRLDPPLARGPAPSASLLPQASRVPVVSTVTHHNLNDLIVIHGIPLQQRTLGLMDRNQDSDERLCHRPGSSVPPPPSKPRPRRALEQSSSSLPRPPQSARRRNPPPRTLLPLAPGLTQPSPAASMDEVIRGTRLITLLPPIGTGDADVTSSGHHSRPGQRQRGSASRAHSAVTDEAASLLPRDRHHLLDVFSRPNTTHTYRSDTPYRRSFTVLDNIGAGRPGRASVGTDSLGIGVTGISLGISSSSFLDSFIHHPLGHSPIEDEEEEPEPRAPPPVFLVPVSVPARAHSRGGIMSRSGRPGL